MLGETLQTLRKHAGVSQKNLASRANTFQANLSEIENGHVNPSLQTANELFNLLGYRLIPVPFNGLTIQEWGAEIDRTLNEGNEKKAFRLFLQINDELSELEPEILQIVVAVPPLIRDIRYSVLVTALVEWHLKKCKQPLPSWVRTNSSKLLKPWFVDQLSPNRESIKRKTPTTFAKRNIYLAESELRSA